MTKDMKIISKLEERVGLDIEASVSTDPRFPSPANPREMDMVYIWLLLRLLKRIEEGAVIQISAGEK